MVALTVRCHRQLGPGIGASQESSGSGRVEAVEQGDTRGAGLDLFSCDCDAMALTSEREQHNLGGSFTGVSPLCFSSRCILTRYVCNELLTS